MSTNSCPICTNECLSFGGDPHMNLGCCNNQYHTKCLKTLIENNYTKCSLCKVKIPNSILQMFTPTNVSTNVSLPSRTYLQSPRLFRYNNNYNDITEDEIKSLQDNESKIPEEKSLPRQCW